MKRARKWIVAGVIGLAAIVVTVRLTHRPSLEADALDILEATESGNGGALFGYLHAYEITALDLDPIKVKRVLDEIVRPRLALLKKVGPRETEIIGRGSQGIASQSYVDPQGRRFDLIASPFATPEGGRTLLSQSILSAWIIEFIVLEGRAFNRETKADAILRGLAQDRQKLEAIGIRGQVDLPPYTAFESWDAVAEKMNGRITRRVN
ncbi:MAG TPA: hypothetical protein PLH94_01015 [Fimbriimonadaceae bacterium]|nr:hypothetical protein [Fimbriimonadaceae bacterium]